MGTGALFLNSIFSAIGSLILMFPLAALAVRGYRKETLPWGKGFALLGVAILLVSVINLLWFSVDPSQLTNTDMSLKSNIHGFLVPLGVSIVVLYLWWRPKAP